jgi:hypothetical protein
MVTPTLTRAAPHDALAFACARVELLAAAVLLRRSPDEAAPGAGQVAALLVEALHGLIAIEERAAGVVSPDGVILLVRN